MSYEIVTGSRQGKVVHSERSSTAGASLNAVSFVVGTSRVAQRSRALYTDVDVDADRKGDVKECEDRAHQRRSQGSEHLHRETQADLNDHERGHVVWASVSSCDHLPQQVRHFQYDYPGCINKDIDCDIRFDHYAVHCDGLTILVLARHNLGAILAGMCGHDRGQQEHEHESGLCVGSHLIKWWTELGREMQLKRT